MSILTTAVRMWLTRSIKPFGFTNEYSKIISYDKEKNLGIYVHIPFCRSLCGFCPYCKSVYNEREAQSYKEALIKEIELVSQKKDKKRVTSLYFGGGTPLLLIDYLKEIIDKIKKHFIIEEGIGIELHPDDVTVENLKALKEMGVDRISIGVQSFQEEFLDILGRKKYDFENMFSALKEVRFKTVSMDFIFALPGQSFELIKKDIDTAFLNGANHIAIYPFIDFTFAKNRITAMKKREKKQLLYKICDYCKEKGYVRSSIWTFSKGYENKYSSMTRDNFLGFGCSATTLLADEFKINTFSLKEYIKRIESGELATSLTLKFTLRQRMVYYLFWTAYTTRLEKEKFKEFFGYDLDKKYGFELMLARMAGFVKYKEGVYEMTKKGSFYYHYYENFYTLSYIDKMWGVMRKEAFPQKMEF